MTTLYLENEKDKERAPDLFKALQEVLDSDEFTLEKLPLGSGSTVDPIGVGLIPWFSLRPGAFIREFCTAWKAGVRSFVAISPDKARKPWKEEDLALPPHLQEGFDNAVGFWSNPTLADLKKAAEEAQNAAEWARIRIQQYAEARILYDECLYKFSHGSRMDLSNQFLAPARLLLMGSVPDDPERLKKWKEVWEAKGSPFKIDTLGDLEKFGGNTGAELCEVARRITDCLNGDPSKGTKTRAPALDDIRSIMQQITRIRETAALKSRSGIFSDAGLAEPPPPVGKYEEAKGYRVLVVDDHAASWRPVFEKLSANLCKGTESMSVCFEFSTDGKMVHEDADPISRLSFGRYDLVILDVFLGAERGTKILECLRRDFSQLPVLLWTTSRDEEITAEATLANGILLKKTVKWDQLENAIHTWVPHGKAMRTTTLPNPFFNHAIKDLECRKLAVEFHEWCLKQLDSFHALDNEFFRYFTDHGGRHIVKLWELMEHAIQPFLGDCELLLPKDEKSREQELLGLYLAVICHELGMFPMRIGGKKGKVENFSSIGRGYLNDVRALHAARGMVLLEDEKLEYWNDDSGPGLGNLLKKHGLQERVATLVGYHARLFKSLRDNDFLNWETASKDLQKKINGLESPVVTLNRGDDVFKRAFERIGHHFPSKDVRARLGRQCAMFRFVDALDITASRNPADFLIGTNMLPPKQYGENLKRELCLHAGIKNGDVFAVMRVQAPSREKVKLIISHVADKKLMKPDDQDQAEKAKSLLDGLSEEELEELVKFPWKPLEHKPWEGDMIDMKSATTLQKSLDRWLEEVWMVLVNGSGKSGFIKHLKEEIEILESEPFEPRLLIEGAEFIASVTALSVAGELLDEYKAIIDTKITEQVRLPNFGSSMGDSHRGFVWDSSSWNKGKLPPSLDKILPEHTAKASNTK